MLSVRSRLCLCLALVMLAAGGGAWAASGSAPSPPPIVLPGATTTTTAPARHAESTTTSSTSTSTTTTRPATTTTVGVSPDAGPAPAGSAPPGFVLPSWAAQVIARSPLSAPNNSGGLVLALRPLLDIGLSPVQAAVLGMGRFPVAGYASWRDDFLDPRFGPDGTFHFHGGEDLVSACGTPLRSPTDGTLRVGSDPAGGNTVEVVQPDRTYFYLAHLSAWVLGQASGQAVRTGQVIGFVGQTGSATGCHLHLEVHPLGGAAVDPKPFVDAWVADAVARAPALIDHVRQQRGLAPLHAAPAVVKPQPAHAPSLPDRETFLWASAANPAGGALALAQADAADAVDAAGAEQLASGAEAQAVGWIEAQLASAASLASSTPLALRPLLGMGPD
jgi:hypothetical protein